MKCAKSELKLQVNEMLVQLQAGQIYLKGSAPCKREEGRGGGGGGYKSVVGLICGILQ